LCGIAGLFELSGKPVALDVLVRMTRTLEHRGPDEEGYFVNAAWVSDRVPLHTLGDGTGCVGLGHRRLSIIDLASGQQPLSNEDRKVWIVFNGEIYNFPQLHDELVAAGHRFRTHSDTEVIVHGYEEWGDALPGRLRGMFAFAIWDERRQRLFCARDRLGKKPLYYLHDGKRLLFGSEIKAILAAPGVDRTIDLEALSDYLALQYIPAPKSIFKSVRKLPQGHHLTADAHGVRVEPYWDLSFATVDEASQEAQEERLLEILGEATKMRMLSEVPLGAFLSGGVDSSAVVALMAQSSERAVRTSCIAFGESAYDESPYAEQVARLFGTNHEVHRVTPEAIPVIETLAWHYDEPFADSSSVPTYYVSKTARDAVTVALSGDGGDENFAGYRRYHIDALENRVRNMLPGAMGRGIFGLLGRIYPKADYLPQMFRAKTFLSNVARRPADAYFFSMSAFKEHQKRQLLRPELLQRLGGYDSAELFRHYYAKADGLDHLSRLQYLDIKTYLCDQVLVKVDRASMAVSLEVRCPILDHEFMEYAARIPSSRKLKGGDKKHIFKRALRRHLPDDILYRKKMGFSMPVTEWLRGDLKEYAGELLLKSEGMRDHFQPGYVETLWNQHQSGRRNYQQELWLLMMFALWHKRFA